MPKYRISGQNITEVAIMFAVVTALYTIMQIYVQRSFNARYKAGADYVHNELAKAAPAFAGLPRQYEPYYTESWQERDTVYNTTAGYPYNSVDKEDRNMAVVVTHAPGPNEN